MSAISTAVHCSGRAELRYLPPYNPTSTRSRMRSASTWPWPVKEEKRTVTALENFQGELMDFYPSEGCAHHHRSFGYATTMREPL